MANQPTKYRKFVVGAASAALVASAVAPVAFAAEFTDVKDNNSHKAAIDALSDAKVISGYPDGTFQPNKTLTRSDVVKLMGKWLIAEGYDVPTDYKTKPRFADLKTTSNDELLKMSALVFDNGVFVGTPDGKLDPNGDITRENMAIVLVRAFDRVHDIDLASYVKDQDFKKDVTDLGKAKAEARPAIDVLDFFDITNPAAPEFNPKNTTTRGQFASFLYKTTLVDFDKIGGGVVAPGVATVKGINATTVEVTFKDTVDNIDSMKFTIDGLTVSNAAVKQTDNKTVVLTTAVQKGGEKYTVTLNDKAIGSFTGIQATVPTSIKLTAGNNQAKVGNQVILSADVGVKEAGIPVTFNIDAPIGSLNKDSVVEVLTNKDGIATYSYTQYAPDADSVTVYPTGAPQLRDFATVYWGKEAILAIEEATATAGNVQANGVKKTYTVTYKDPKTGKPLANRNLNVTFVENLNVPFNAISKATVTNPATGVTITPYQTSTNLFEAIQVKTDSEGKATFIVSGTNTAVTPAVFVDGSQANTGFGSGTDILGNANGIWESTELTVTAPQVKFEGAQLQSQISVVRDGEEEAAAVYGTKTNGREYSVKVNDKDGKAYANGLVNVGLDELIDRNLSTDSKAKFTNVEGSSVITKGNNTQQIELKLDSKGEAKFVLYGAKGDVGTPVVWIDQNTAENNQSGVLENGEPFFKAPVSNFQSERVIGGRLLLEGKTSNQTASADGIADYEFFLTNQSNKTLANLAGKLTYEVRNTSGQPIRVTTDSVFTKQDGVTGTSFEIEEYGSITLTREVATQVESKLRVNAKEGKAASVLVTPAFVTSNNFDASADNGTVKDARDANKYVSTTGLTATLNNSLVVGAQYTGVVSEFNTADTGANSNSLWFVGKNPIKYAGAAGETYKYFGANGNEIFGEAAWETYLNNLATAGNQEVTISYDKAGDVNTFKVIAVRTNAATAIKKTTVTAPGADQAAADAATKLVTELPAVADLKVADKAKVEAAKAAIDALTPAQKALVTTGTMNTLAAAQAKIAELEAAQAEVQITSAEAFAMNSIASNLGLFVEYKVEGTVANTTATTAELVFTYQDQTQATKTKTQTVTITDGKFSSTLDTENDIFNTIEFVQVKVGDKVSDKKTFAPKVK